ncbi:NAD(P)-binding protein [Massarina eburnea CBS 473.64]|uniref:NAD(P)-binding protein n=1 Tax=Massarina eburnea CBS 473.64 TaxID=1395130 RepID=A0A6A6RTF3_9PLEO|nr:NAD(P)-binding protein [Massarina eburnea CBS 473.64]
MQPLFPSPVPTWHNDTYPAIDPSSPELSQAGKTVIVTGAGSGIGRATAIAFAQAKASHIVLLGRTESTLRETEALISGDIKISVFPSSVSDEAQMEHVADKVGDWDVLVLNAGNVGVSGHIMKSSLEDIWGSYETNVKSIIIAAHQFFPRAKKGASVLAVGAGGCILPPVIAPNIGGYCSSKVAQAKLVEFLAAENPEIFICSVHPGVVQTDMLVKAGLDAGQLPKDTVELPAHFMVWLSQPKARFLNGKFLWTNWDVEELSAKAEEWQSGITSTIGLVGWPFESSREALGS